MTADEIKRVLRYRLQGTKKMKQVVIEILSSFPSNVASYVATHCWFIGSMEDAWAFTLRAEELKSDEYLIFISDELLSEPLSQIRFTLAHEVGHVMLGHKNGILQKQSKRDITKQEREADAFARSLVSASG